MSLLDTISSDTLDDIISDNNDDMLDVSSIVLVTLLKAPNDEIFNNAKYHCHLVCSKLIVCVNMLITMQMLTTIIIMKKKMVKTVLIIIDLHYKVPLQNIKHSYHR